MVYDPKTATDGENVKTFVEETAPLWFGHYERYLARSEGPYLTSAGLTIADIAIFDVVDNAVRAGASLDDKPLLQAHRAAIAGRPNIAKCVGWIAIARGAGGLES